MIGVFNDDETIVGIFCLVAAVIWTLLAIYSVYLFVKARQEWRKLGGMESTKKQAASSAVSRMIHIGIYDVLTLFTEAAKHPELVKATVQATV